MMVDFWGSDNISMVSQGQKIIMVTDPFIDFYDLIMFTVKYVLYRFVYFIHGFILLKFVLISKHDIILRKKERIFMENKQVPPVVPNGQRDNVHPSKTKYQKSSMDIKMVLSIVLGLFSLGFTILGTLHGFFYVLALAFGIASVVIALLSFEITKPKVIAAIVSIVALALAMVMTGNLIMTNVKNSWSYYNMFHNYSYDDTWDDFWD